MTPRLALRQQPDSAFETLYRRHVHEVYRYALAMLGSAADAEDVTQTTFMNAYRAFQSGDHPRKPRPWLRKIAHNVCLQRFRQAARRPDELFSLDESTAPALEEPDGPSAADITRALRSLPFNQRAALVMRELEGRRQAEIAAELGVTESAVEALLFRARRAMREQLEDGLTCNEAARAISRQLDSSLPRADRAALRAHLRECEDCASFARSARAQRGAMKKLGVVPLPASLLSWSSGGATVGVGIGAKIAAGIAATVLVAGATDVGVHALRNKPAPKPAGVSAAAKAGHPVSSNATARALANPLTPRAKRARSTAAVMRHTRHGRVTAAVRGEHRDSPAVTRQSHQNHPALHTHPAHPAHPTTPATTKTHPVKPTHPATPPHPSQSANPPKPAHPAKPPHPLTPDAGTNAPDLLPSVNAPGRVR